MNKCFQWVLSIYLKNFAPNVLNESFNLTNLGFESLLEIINLRIDLFRYFVFVSLMLVLCIS